VALLRAYARYLKQIRLGFDLGYIASTLNNHTDIARELTRLFKTRFYLARKLTADDLEDKQQRLEQAILAHWTTFRCSTKTASCVATWT
jgi:glutamate dehydrogenase